ncbi:SusE domain-containing protein [Lutimonas halocynthiae]|uniref:SusE domain-containing protein n=1 Tax=Lutimonas halocynthiae TaxID=1446477 RepID=UPI0025B52D16|nr:SusE domain-containing protein [Lutimonas halocynthiae]MDN3641190.1 SusE domain-containing protein [Lutimonas halocynthiae]
MKKYINKILFLLTFSALIVGCEKDDIVVINEDFTTAVSLSSDNIVLEEANEGAEALKVTWTQPDFGYNAAAEYNVLFDISGGDFTSPETVSAGSALEKSFNTEDLNKILLNLGAEPDDATQLEVKIDIIMSKQYRRASDVSSLTATAYSGVLDLTTTWGVVGSATPNGWGDGPDTPFFKTSEPGINVAYINMVDGEWKIRQDNDWTLNYGSSDGVNLVEGGDNIAVTAGTYKITFDEDKLTYAIEAYSWGLVGSATPNGWDGPDVPLMYDSCSDTWKAVVKLNEGVWKIRQNNDWAVNLGSDGADGNLQANGGDIPVTLGYYQIVVDFNASTYTIEKTDIWGVVGSGYNDWGATPDFPFTPDYCNEGIYHAYGVPILDGEIKFRTNNDWGNNYGDFELDNILDQVDDNNIPSVAGTYDIMLDFTNPSVPTYTMTKK